MLTEYPLDIAAEKEYAMLWWDRRNPEYTDFSEMGGDCTSFVSQILYAGGAVMNHTPDCTGNNCYHSLYVVDVRNGEPLIAAHSFDAYERPLSSYSYYSARCLQIRKARRYE